MSDPHPDPMADLTSPHILDGRFEPEAKVVITTISDAALTSIAVSLKRIADKLDSPHGHELDDIAFQAGIAFENGRRQIR